MKSQRDCCCALNNHLSERTDDYFRQSSEGLFFNWSCGSSLIQRTMVASNKMSRLDLFSGRCPRSEPNAAGGLESPVLLSELTNAHFCIPIDH